MLRFALALWTGLACLMLAQSTSPAAVPDDGDVLLVLQKDKDKKKAPQKHYSINKRLQSIKGKTGHFRVGSTATGHHINAHVKNGKITKMSMHTKDGKVVHHKRVIKQKKLPKSTAKLKAHTKGVHKVTRGPAPDADVVRVARRGDDDGFAGFVIVTVTVVRVIWVPVVFVDPVVFISAGEDLEVRRTPPPLPALLPRRVDLELG